MIEQGSDIFGNPYLLCFELETSVGMEKNTKYEQTQKVPKTETLPFRKRTITYPTVGKATKSWTQKCLRWDGMMLVAST